MVGAGPAGLTCALVLARQGVEVEVVEAQPGPITGARAVMIQSRALELFDRLGVVDRALERGMPIRTVDNWLGRRRVTSLSLERGLAGLTAYPHALGLEQALTQRLLLEALGAEPSARVRWATEVTGLRPTGPGVRLEVLTPDGGDVVEADYVVGADGVRSTVRTLLGTGVEGTVFARGQVAADIVLPGGLPTDALVSGLAFGRSMSAMTMASDPRRFRVFGFPTPELEAKLRPDWDASRLTLDDVHAWLRSFFPEVARPTELLSASSYRIRRELADRFREGRVFLVGDAAHAHSPAGGQGVTNNMGDAFNLAWKLALVCRGLAGDRLLDSYEAERRPVARRIVNGASALYQGEAAEGRAVELARLVGTLATGPAYRIPLVRRALSRITGQLWPSYRRSPIVTDRIPTTRWDRAPRAGDRLNTVRPEQVRPGAGDQWVMPADLDHHLLALDGRRAGARAWTPGEVAGLEDLPARTGLPMRVHHLPRHQWHVHDLLGADDRLLVLLRPDGFLGFRGRGGEDVAALERLLRGAYGAGGAVVAAAQAVEGSVGTR